MSTSAELVANGAEDSGPMPAVFRHKPAWIIATVAAIAVVIAFDGYMELGVAAAVPYIAAVWIAYFSRSVRWVISTSAICMALAVAGYFLSDPGGDAWMVITNRVIAGSAIVITMAFCVHMIRTERINDEIRLDLAGIVNNSLDAMVSIDVHDRVKTWNPSAERIFGYTAGEAIGKPLADLIIPADLQEQYQQHLGTYLLSGQGPTLNDRIEMELRHKEGHAIPAEMAITPVTKRGSSELAFQLRDITQRRNLEQRFRATVESAPAAMLMVDAQGQIVLANRESARLFGYEADDLLGKSIEILVPERFKMLHPDMRQGFMGHPSARSMGAGRELYAARKDGSEFPVEIGLNPLETDEGTFVLSAVIDITERKNLESRQRQLNEDLERQVAERTSALATTNESLRQRNEELQQFVYVASHDLQEPLRMVTSYVGLIEESYGDQLDETGQKFMHFAVDGATRMSALIRDLLQYSRLDSRGQPFEQTQCEEVVDEALANLQEEIDEVGAIIVREALPVIDGDRTQLVQLFQQLIGNSLKYRPEQDPEIKIGAKRGKTGMWEFYVSDNGIGLDPEHAERIFVIFQRLHGRGQYAGTGIGLALCKKIVQHHGGKIWVESQPGQGATFHFTLAEKLAAV